MIGILEINTLSYTKREDCRSCGGTALERFLSLGPMPLANSFIKSRELFSLERSYPLDVYYCRACHLVQLLDVVDPETLFRDYVYVSGMSETMAEHYAEFVQTIDRMLELNDNDLVVEIGSNDGSLLKRFKSLDIRILGVEPAANIARIAEGQGVETVNAFFDPDTSREIRRSKGAARVILANNVLAHVDDTPGFLLGCYELLRDDGVLVIEVPYLGDLIEKLEYDTIYHEHLCYFSVSALTRLFGQAGLMLDRIDKIGVHGGSLRIFATRTETGSMSHSEQVESMARQEEAKGLCSFESFENFGNVVATNRESIRTLLRKLRDEGKSIAAYGAPAKGNTLLNFCSIDTNLVSYTVDKNPLKVNRFTPGVHLPVAPVSRLLEDQPDFVLILAWNLANEIMSQQEEYQTRGGRFIIPIPLPRMV